MTRYATPSLVAVTACAVSLAVACGHTDKTLDAFEASKQNPVGSESTTIPTYNVACAPQTSGPQFDCNAAASQQFDAETMAPYCVSPEVEELVNTTFSIMNQSAKANQMMGVPVGTMNYRDIERSPDTQVSGIGTIRGYRYRDAGRGVNLDAGQDNRPNGNNFATVFPTASARAASWDLDLERRIGVAIGDETAASKNNMLLAPCMNIIRHPYWGRTQETYSEDTYHTGRMATALTVGLQEFVVACAKHYAANNVERFRSKQNAIMSEQTLREIYGRHFEMVVQDGGVGCIMASYNLINGVKSTQNEHLLRDMLKAPVEQGGMGFEGLVLTDWWAMPGDQNEPDPNNALTTAVEAVRAGTDIEVPWQLYYSQTTLAGSDIQPLVDEAARRVLTQKFRFKSARSTDGWSLKQPTSTLDGDSIAPNATHESLAEEAAVKSAVLLANGLDAAAPPVLPLTSATTIAVVGPDQEFQLISSSLPKSCGSTDPDVGQGVVTEGRKCTFHYYADPALGDRGSSRVNGDPARAYGPAKGIREIATTLDKTVTAGSTVEQASVDAADAIVVVVGYTAGDEGEEYAISGGGDRSTLDLPMGQNQFVNDMLSQNKPTVIIIEAGSIVNLPWLDHPNRNQATIWAGYPGIRGGLAFGRLIFGLDNFSGKMPMAWPTQTTQDLMVFKDGEEVTNMGYFFGYREYDRRQYVEEEAIDMVFPFGWGMSYSTFEYSNLVSPCETVTKEAVFNVSIDIENTSAIPGDEVAMLFVKPPPKPAGITGERPWKELKSFVRVSVPANETVTAELPLRIQDLRRWEGGAEDGQWVIDSGAYTILVGKNAEDAETTANQATLMVSGD